MTPTETTSRASSSSDDEERRSSSDDEERRSSSDDDERRSSSDDDERRSSSAHETVVFESAGANERSVARLRLFGALVAIVGSLWIATLSPGAIGVGIALVALAAAAFWIRAGTRALRQRPPRLALAREHLELREHDTTTTLSWTEVTDVAVDEDRLLVRVSRGEREPLVIEPVFAGVSVYALADAIRDARARAAGEA